MTSKYETIEVTYFNNAPTFIEYGIIVELDNGTRQTHSEKLSYAEGRRKMYELMKRGGEYRFTVNRFDCNICYKQVTFFELHY